MYGPTYASSTIGPTYTSSNMSGADTKIIKCEEMWGRQNNKKQGNKVGMLA